MSDLFDGLNEAVLAVFGESVTYQQNARADIAISVAWVEEVPESTAPGRIGRVSIEVAAMDFSPKPGDRIIRGSDIYRVVEPIVNDGGGMWVLQVRK